jgi:hypothetical protein
MSPGSVYDILSRPAAEAVDGFMVRWHGAQATENAPPGAQQLPAVLRRFYESYGTAVDAFLVNHLLPAAEVAEDGGVTVFYVEEQAVYLWGIATADLASEDPPVHCRENEPSEPWFRESPSVSTFLVQMLVMSAALNGPHGASAAWLSPEETEHILAPLARLDLPPWHWPGHPARWYAGYDTVAFTAPNLTPEDDGHPHLSVWVGSLTEDGVKFIEPHLNDAWDYYSPRDS